MLPQNLLVIVKPKATTATAEKPVGNAIAYSQAVNTATPAAFVVPGLPSHITPDAVVGMMPKFEESAIKLSTRSIPLKHSLKLQKPSLTRV
jgi:hypothetical protein